MTQQRLPGAAVAPVWDPSEHEFQLVVIEACRTLGWRVAHFRPAQTSKGWRTPVAADGAGFPDLVIAGHGHVFFRELKTERGRVRPDQEAWLATLTSCGADAAVWRARDWDTIVHTLGAAR